MASKRDYYEVLGVDRQSGDSEIKRAYRKRALKFHPDNYRGDKSEGETRFKELAEAYEVLSDPQKRRQYDQFGHEGMRGAGLHDFSSMGFGDIFSMFQDIFSGAGFGGGSSTHERGGDLETEVALTLQQVSEGADQVLEFERMDLCKTCDGSGAKAGTQPDKCDMCGGYGRVRQQVPGFFGLSVRITECPNCSGRGTVSKEKCSSCRGSGRGRMQRTLTVHIPAGIRDGQVVRVRGEGEPGHSSNTRGDLHVYVRVAEHPLLTRRGNDLFCQVPLSISTAGLGGPVNVPTLTGPEKINIPSGTQNGHVLTLKKRGLPSVRGGQRGDLHVQVFVEVPKKLSRKQRDALQAFAEGERKDLTPARKAFRDAMKNCFKDST